MRHGEADWRVRRPRRRDMMVATAWEVHGRLEALAEGGAQSLDRGLAGMAAVADQRRRLQARPAPSLLWKRVKVVYSDFPMRTVRDA